MIGKSFETSLTEIIDQVAGALEKATAEHGPKAVELALEVGRIAAIKEIVTGLFLVALAITAVCVLRKFWPMFVAGKHKPDGYFVVCLVSGSVAILISVLAMSKLLAIHAWVGMFHPEIYLAYRALFG